MKKIKKLMLSFSIIGMVLILSIGGCKKELSPNSEKLNNADLLMSKEAGPGKKKVLRKSPGLKIVIKGDTIKRISPTLKNIDKITSILNEEQSKKNQGGVMTTKSANFTASLAGTYYNCYAELNDPGPYDWYLINWYTGVYTYIGSSTDYINFNVQKPSMYGSYRVWGEGPYGAGFTGYQYMGDPYSGVSVSGGLLTFSSTTDRDNLLSRMEQAYEDHQSNFFDQYDHLSDDYVNGLADSEGFDEFLPLREFEAHFGFSSLRASLETAVLSWADNTSISASNYPDMQATTSEAEQSILNTSGQLVIGSTTYDIDDYTLMGPSGASTGICYQNVKFAEEDSFNSDSDKKVIMKLAHHGNGTFLWPHARWKAKAITFKKKSNGKWKKWATKMNAKVDGNIYDYGSCSYIGSHNQYPNATKRKFSRKAVETLATGYESSWAVQKNYFNGFFTINGDSKSIHF